MNASDKIISDALDIAEFEEITIEHFQEEDDDYTFARKNLRSILEKGSIEIPDSPKPKLLLEHDAKKPIGRMVSYREDEDGMYATFKISNTTRKRCVD